MSILLVVKCFINLLSWRCRRRFDFGDLTRSIFIFSFPDTTTVTGTTTHTATGPRITPPTIPELTTDHRITVDPTTSTLDRLTTGTRITTPDLTRKVEIGETTITEVAPGITRLKVGTTRTAIGTAIRRRDMEICRALRSLAAKASDMARTSEALRLIEKKDDIF